MEHDECKLEQLEELCRERGLRLTVQKRRILETIVDREDHPTADQIYGEVKEQVPGISRATVYRTLESFSDEGLVRKVYHPDDEYRFDANTHHHHHLVCEECSEVTDIVLPEIDHLNLEEETFEDFEVNDYSVYFRGTCEACREEASSSTSVVV